MLQKGDGGAAFVDIEVTTPLCAACGTGGGTQGWHMCAGKSLSEQASLLVCSCYFRFFYTTLVICLLCGLGNVWRNGSPSNMCVVFLSLFSLRI